MKKLSIAFLLIYFGVLLFISLKDRKMDNSEDYFLAGRGFSKWALALTFIASWYGGSACLISADQTYSSGIGSFWVTSGPNALAPIILIFFAIMIRKLGVISQVKVMDMRYSKATGTFLSIIIIWYMMTWAASQMVSMGLFFSTYLGFSYIGAILFGVVIVLIYALVSGFKGVVLTDMAQFWFLLVAMIILMVTGIKSVGGLGDMVRILNEKSAVNGIQYFNIFEGFGTNFMYVISFGLGWVISADVWQRINASRTPKDARGMLIIAAIAFIPLGFISIMVGLSGAALFDTMPEGGIVSHLATTMMNPWLGALIFVGVGAALMSTMDTAINTGSLTLTEDIYHKLINKDAENKQLVNVGMIGTLIITVAGLFIAFKLRNILWVLWMASDIIMCGVFTPIIMAFIWRRGNSKGALSSMIGGSTFVLYNTLADLGMNLPTPWPGWPYRLLYGLAIAVILYFGVSLLTEPEYEKADAFMKKAKGLDEKINVGKA